MASRSGPPFGNRAYLYVGVQDNSNDSSVTVSVYPSANPTPGIDWKAAFSDSNISGPAGFWISVKTDDGYQFAWGELNPERITVSGAADCSAGTLAPPPAPGGVPHDYVVKDPICSTSASPSCTALNVFSLLLLLPTDPTPKSQPATTCDVTDTPLGPVVHYVDFPDLSVINVTLPNHQLYPGQVIRSVINENGEISIQTIGTGTGMWPWLNKKAADYYWGTVDDVIRVLFLSAF